MGLVDTPAARSKKADNLPIHCYRCKTELVHDVKTSYIESGNGVPFMHTGYRQFYNKSICPRRFCDVITYLKLWLISLWIIFGLLAFAVGKIGGITYLLVGFALVVIHFLEGYLWNYNDVPKEKIIEIQNEIKKLR